MIAVLPVFGVIGRRMNMMSDISGGCSLEQLSTAFDTLLETPAVSTIVMQFDSPGGSVYGVSEFATKVFKARSQKQTIAVVDPMACSAAYWIASACESIVCTPSGDVGSIGTIAVHMDDSAADEAEGIKYTVIKAGKYKDEGVHQPLSPEAVAALQIRIDSFNTAFVDAIAKYRGTTSNKVATKFGEGRIVQASDALAVGMIDRIATMDDVISELAASKKASQNRAAIYRERRASLAS